MGGHLIQRLSRSPLPAMHKALTKYQVTKYHVQRCCVTDRSTFSAETKPIRCKVKRLSSTFRSSLGDLPDECQRSSISGFSGSLFALSLTRSLGSAFGGILISLCSNDFFRRSAFTPACSTFGQAGVFFLSFSLFMEKCPH